MDEDSPVEWREWGAAAFEAAAGTGRPVLLSLSATWCADCHRMDRETYAEPRIAANVNDGFVPVRVDVDRRPRVRERYNMGGFPSTVFCTPDGSVLTGAGYLGPEGMRQVLDRVREMWDARGDSAGRVPRALTELPPAGEVTASIEENLAGQLSRAFDGAHGGWGTDAKFPLPRTVEFALKRERSQALRTLDAVRDHLFDDVAGGFHRFAAGRDWSGVHREKLAEPNAALVRAFANGYLYTGEEAYRRPAARTVAYLTDDLWTGQAVGGSQGPAAGRAYYELDADGRADEPAPRRDLTAFAGGNAMAADAFCTLYAYTDDERAREYAERVLAFLRSTLVEDGLVTRFRSGETVGEAGLLDDQARVVAAFARAAQVLGGDHLDVARRVADRTLATLRDETVGAFRDGPADGEGLLDRPLYPLDGTVEAADALVDLAALTGEERYREAAREAVAAFAGAADRVGVQVAGYGAVAARLRRPPLVIEVGTPPGSDLHRAALRVADHEKVVVPDGDASPEGTATVRGADADAAPAETPAALADLVSGWSATQG
jgi:uncharacterized protein YyaL (SSP411 family)